MATKKILYPISQRIFRCDTFKQIPTVELDAPTNKYKANGN
jgi:hypothetical protein